MQPSRRTVLKGVASIGIAGSAVGATSTAAASDGNRVLSIYSQDDETFYYSVRFFDGDDYTEVDGYLQPDAEVNYQFEGRVSTFYSEGEVLANADELDPAWCQENNVNCNDTKSIWSNGQGCYVYYDATTSGSGCLYDESTSFSIDGYLDLLQFDIDSSDGSMYYY